MTIIGQLFEDAIRDIDRVVGVKLHDVIQGHISDQRSADSISLLVHELHGGGLSITCISDLLKKSESSIRYHIKRHRDLVETSNLYFLYVQKIQSIRSGKTK